MGTQIADFIPCERKSDFCVPSGMVDVSATPRLLRVEEPSAGVNPALADRRIERIRILKEKGLSIIIIEHAIPYVLALSDELYVLNKGAVLASGRPDAVISDRRVFEAYLGEGA